MDGGMREERALGRIAAILVMLSLVAERAAGRSLPVRFLLLLILRRADAVVTAFVVRETQAAGATGDDFPWLGEEADSGSSPLHAAWFALRFRLLAEVLVLCCAAGRSGDDTGDTAGNWANNRADNPTRLPATAFPTLLLVFPARCGLLVHDTS